MFRCLSNCMGTKSRNMVLQYKHILHQARPHVLDVSHDGLDISYTQKASRLQHAVPGRLFCSGLGGVSLVQLQLCWRISLVPPPAGSGGSELRACIYGTGIVWAAGVRQPAHLQVAYIEGCSAQALEAASAQPSSSCDLLVTISAHRSATRCHQGEKHA